MLTRSRGLGLSSSLFALALLAALAASCGASASPAISNVWPLTIVPGQTRTLLIAGQGFQNGATVTLGGVIAAPNAVWVNEHYLAADVPGSMGGAGSKYSVVVTNPDRQQAVSPQVVVVGAAPPETTPTAVPTRAPSPVATPRRPVATPIEVATPAPTPILTPTPTATSSAPVVIIVPPLQPMATPTATEIATAPVAATPAAPPVQTASPTPSAPPSQRPVSNSPLSPARPGLPGQPGRQVQH